jgi:hypothetical protein
MLLSICPQFIEVGKFAEQGRNGSQRVALKVALGVRNLFVVPVSEHRSFCRFCACDSGLFAMVCQRESRVGETTWTYCSFFFLGWMSTLTAPNLHPSRRPRPNKLLTRATAPPKLRDAVLESLQNALWVWGAGVQIALLAGMLWRRTYAVFPTFVAYIAYQATKSLVLVGLNTADPWLYFWGYWGLEFFSLILVLAVLQEQFESLVRHESRTRRLGTILFWIFAGAASLIVATTLQIGSGLRESRLMVGVLTAEQALRIVQTGILLFLFAFSALSKVPWHPAARGIALGMGIFIAAELVIVTARQTYGPDFRKAFFLLKPIAYNVAMLVWLHAVVFRVKHNTEFEASPALGDVSDELAEMLR